MIMEIVLKQGERAAEVVKETLRKFHEENK